MIDGQTSIFEMLYPTFKIDKPVRLIELFAGYGSQALALKYLGVEFDHWKICEWAIKSIQAYKDIHFSEDDTDYSKDIPIENIKETLFNVGISANYNEPMSEQQVNRLSEKQARTIFNNITATHNLVNIQKTRGTDLEITDTNDYCYIMTYSFPCQDLSLAGLGKGMKDTSTRSGMLWEVERILSECKELGKLPQVLLMENVPQVHSVDNTEDFNKWQLRLEELGYKNYWQDLIATDYGIPQTRNRTFMVSILGDYNYTFPSPIPLKLKLKDMLEENVDEKYYLSDKMINCFLKENENGKFPRDERFKQSLKSTNEKNVAGTITTAAGNRATDNFIIGNIEQWHQRGNVYSEEYSSPTICATDYKTPKLVLTKDTENYIEWEDGKNIQMNCRAWKDDKVIATLNTGGETKILENKALQETLEKNDLENIEDIAYIDSYNKKIRNDNLSNTITTRVNDSNNSFLLIKNATKKGYLEAEEGDGIDISSRMEYHRGTVQKGMTQTLSTMGGENNGVVVNMRNKLCNNLIENDLVEENDIIKINYTTEVMSGNKDYKINNNISPTLTTASNNEIAVVTDETNEVEKIGSVYEGEKANRQGGSIYNKDKSSPTLSTGHGYAVPMIDCIGTYQYAKSDNFMQGKDRLQIGKEVSDTLQTTQKEGVVTIGNYSPSNHNASRVVDKEYSAPTVMENHGTITATQLNNLRIRKLTPNECFRLMGVRDEDYFKVKKNQSDASLYHLAGDSIVVNVLCAIFGEMI